MLIYEAFSSEVIYISDLFSQKQLLRMLFPLVLLGINDASAHH